jgi:gliding motility-associated-like protein
MKDQTIEQLFREGLDNMESDVPAETWEAIENRLDALMPAAGTATSAVTGLAGKWLAGGAILSAITAAVYFLSTGNEDKKEALPEKAPSAEVIRHIPEAIVTPQKSLSIGQLQVPAPAEQQPSDEEVNIDAAMVSFETFTASDQIKPLELPADPVSENIPEMDKSRAEGISHQQEKISSAEVMEGEVQEGSPAEILLQEETSHDFLSSVSLPVPEIKYHDVITPNLDNINDIFRVEANEAVRSFTVTVRNLSGKVIHQWSAPYGFWDGRLEDGRLAPAGKYLIDIFVQPVKGRPYHKAVTVQLIR